MTCEALRKGTADKPVSLILTSRLLDSTDLNTSSVSLVRLISLSLPDASSGCSSLGVSRASRVESGSENELRVSSILASGGRGEGVSLICEKVTVLDGGSSLSVGVGRGVGKEVQAALSEAV